MLIYDNNKRVILDSGDCSCEHETNGAYLLEIILEEYNFSKKIWLPKSQVFYEAEGKFDIPVWLLEKNGLYF